MFQKGLAFIKGLLGSASALAPILSLFGVAIPPTAIAAVPLVVSLMNEAENAMGDGTGPLKKQAVEAGANAFVKTMQTVSTGGQADTYAKLTPEAVGILIDAIAGVANNISVAIGNKPVIDDGTVWQNITQQG